MAQLQLLASPPGTGKTTFCIDLFKKGIQKTKNGIGSRCFFILPNQEHADRIQNMILKKDVQGLFNTHILTINHFTARLLGVAAAKHPTDAIRLRVIQEILDSNTPFDYFKQSGEYEGVAELILETIREFKASLLTVREFERSCQPLLGKAYFRQKFKDFSVILKQYENRLKEMELTEPEDEIRELFENKELILPTDLVIFDGFYHFTNAQKKLIEAAVFKAKSVVVSLTLNGPDERPALFWYPEQTRRDLVKLGFKEKRGFFKQNKRTEKADLQHLEQQLFSAKPKVFPAAATNIKIFEAPNRRHELDRIAREIKRLYREEEVHYSDICVIFRKLSGLETAVESAFSRYQIPFYLHERKKMIEHGAIQVLYRLLKLISDEWQREDLLFVLKSSYFMKDRDFESALEIEQTAWSLNLRAGRDQWLSALESGRWKESAQSLFRRTADVAGQFENAKDANLFKRRVLDFYSEMTGSQQTDEKVKAVDEKAGEALAKILDQLMIQSDKESGFDALSVIRQLQKSLEKALYSVKPAGKNRVQIYDVVMAMPKEYKVVFMANLVEKSFPEMILENPIFKDHERRVFNKKSVVLEERRNRRFGEKYFFYMGVTRAKQKLYLSYPAYDTDGKTLLTSFFVEEVRQCFKEIPFFKKNLQDTIPGPAEWEAAEDVALGLCGSLFQAQPKDGLADIAARWLSRGDFRQIVRAGLWDESAKITDARVRSLIKAASSRFSATKLETFATCAFKYFSERVLHLQRPFEDTRFLEMGRILHAVLEEYYKNKLPSKKLLPLLEAELDKSAFSHEPLYRKRLYYTQMKRTLLSFTESEEELSSERDFSPAHFEMPFAEKFSLGKDGGDALLEGKIDRVDVSGDGQRALVVDYKLSKRAQSIEKKLSKGIEIQMPLYALMVKRLTGLSVVGVELKLLQGLGKEGIYVESSRDELGLSKRKTTYSDEAFGALLDESEQRIREYIARIRGGDIAIRSKSCEYCSFNPLCRFEKWKLAYENIL